MQENKQIISNESEVQQGFEVSTGKQIEVTIEIPKGSLACFLLDENMFDVLPYYPYKIHDINGKVLEGETNEFGYFYHENLPAAHYSLRVNDINYVIPTLQEEDEPYQVRVLGEEGQKFEQDEIRDISEEIE
jgi:hypothetical protein